MKTPFERLQHDLETQKVHFIHCRKYDKEGNVLGKGGYTIAYKVVLDEDQAPCIQAAVARCSKKDAYCRKSGRIKASSRLNSLTQSFRMIYIPDRQRLITHLVDEAIYFLIEGQMYEYGEDIRKPIDVDFKGWVKNPKQSLEVKYGQYYE